jgi:hypothetical protein
VLVKRALLLVNAAGDVIRDFYWEFVKLDSITLVTITGERVTLKAMVLASLFL